MFTVSFTSSPRDEAAGEGAGWEVLFPSPSLNHSSNTKETREHQLPAKRWCGETQGKVEAL